jgi:hypothetical protein
VVWPVSAALEELLGRPRIAGEDQRAARAGLADDRVRAHDRAASERHGLATLEPPEQGPLGNAELARRVDVEPARALVLDDRVPDARHMVVGGERVDPVPGALHGLPGRERPHLDLVREPADHRLQDGHEIRKSCGPVEPQRRLTRPQRERLQHAGQAEDVVGMAVGDQDVVDVDQSDSRAQELALRPLAAVHQDAVAASPHEVAGGAAMGARRRTGGAQEEDAHVHRAIVRAGVAGSGDARRNFGHARATEVTLGQHRPGPAQEDVEPEELALVSVLHEPERRRRQPAVTGRATLVEMDDAGIRRREDAQMSRGAHGSTSFWPATICEPGMSLATLMR